MRAHRRTPPEALLFDDGDPPPGTEIGVLALSGAAGALVPPGPEGVFPVNFGCNVDEEEDSGLTTTFRFLNVLPRLRPGLDIPMSQMGARSSHSRQKLSSSRLISTLSIPVEN